MSTPIEVGGITPELKKSKSPHRWCFVVIGVCITITVAVLARHIGPGPENAWEPYESPQAIYSLAPSNTHHSAPYFLEDDSQPDWRLVEAVVDVAIRNVENLRAWYICLIEAQAMRQLSLGRLSSSQLKPNADAKGGPRPVDYALDVNRMGVITQTLGDTDIPCTGKDPNRVNYVGFLRIRDSRDGKLKTLVISDRTVLGDELASAERAVGEGVCYEDKKAERDEFAERPFGDAPPGILTPEQIDDILKDFEVELYLLEKLQIPCR